MEDELFNVMICGPCVSPFKSKNDAESFAEEFRKLLARFTDEPMDVYVSKCGDYSGCGVVL